MRPQEVRPHAQQQYSGARVCPAPHTAGTFRAPPVHAAQRPSQELPGSQTCPPRTSQEGQTQRRSDGVSAAALGCSGSWCWVNSPGLPMGPANPGQEALPWDVSLGGGEGPAEAAPACPSPTAPALCGPALPPLTAQGSSALSAHAGTPDCWLKQTGWTLRPLS